MSYDMNIGGEDFNYTYNVAPMWYSAFPDDGIRKHYGKSGADAIPILRGLRLYMENNQEKLIKMNPDNGWGDYYGALEFVNKLIIASLRNPDEVWEGD